MKIKMLFFVLAAGLISISFVNVSQEAVYVYNSEGGKFSVNFPTQFTDKIQETEYFTEYSASSKGDGMLFKAHARVNVIDDELLEYYELEEHKEELYDDRIMEFVNNIKGELINTVDATSNGVNGKIAIMKMGENKVFYSIYMKGKIEYQLLVVELTKGSLNDSMVNSFKNSLKIF